MCWTKAPLRGEAGLEALKGDVGSGNSIAAGASVAIVLTKSPASVDTSLCSNESSGFILTGLVR